MKWTEGPPLLARYFQAVARGPAATYFFRQVANHQSATPEVLMQVHILSVPYDSGHAEMRMGRGPDAFLTGGLPERLQESGFSVELTRVEPSQRFPTEITTAFELSRQLTENVRAATRKGAIPLVLTGNCISCLGSVAGLGTDDLGVFWFDAHADYHTPETTPSGFLDGMALAIATGACWKTAVEAIPGFRPVPAQKVVLLGARAFDPGERERFEAAGGIVLDPPSIRSSRIGAALTRFRKRVRRLYVHLDLDVLDPGEGRANTYATPGGLSRQELLGILSRVREQFTVAAVALSAYDPAGDPERRVLDAGIEFVQTLLQ